MLTQIADRIELLDSWIDRNGWHGWDPYDLKGHALFLQLQQNPSSGIARLYKTFCLGMSEVFPIFSRRVLKIRPQINAKGIALLAMAYILHFKLSANEHYLYKYHDCINWLLDNSHVKSDRHLGWGYPFDWQSLIFFPKETPLGVPSALAGQALLDGWEVLGDEIFLKHANQVKDFFIEKLNIIRFPQSGGICFSYSPLDDYLVVNSNLYVAAFLTRYGVLADDRKTLRIARQARLFSIRQQDDDGAWPYWARSYRVRFPRFVDNYHTGITLQWLALSNAYDPSNNSADDAVIRGLDYYLKNLFTAEGAARFTDHRTYPLDIHGPAQAFATFNQLADYVLPDLVRKVFTFTMRTFSAPQGHFYYRVMSIGKHRRFTSKIPYFRWGQAWMRYGLVNLYQYFLKAKERYASEERAFQTEKTNTCTSA